MKELDLSDVAIKVENVGKLFKLPHEKQSSIKSAFINSYRRKRTYEIQKALNDISFEVKKGEFFGIVGRNGSGKSTLLKLLAGIYIPTKGNIEVNGKLTPFIELGVGFNAELTGRENVFLNGALLGFSRKEMLAMYKDIVEFAELQKFMDQKLKNYSSGMQVRLAFSIAIRSQCDILLIDEVLAVGDVNFQHKCFDVFRKLKDTSKTIVFVSHDLNSIEEFCDRVALIDDGQLLAMGDPATIVMKYRGRMAKSEVIKDETEEHLGVGGVRITKLEVLSKGKVIKQLTEGEQFSIKISYEAKEVAKNPVFGLAIVNEDSNIVAGPNTHEAQVSTGSIKGRGNILASFKNNPLTTGRYTFMVSCFTEDLSAPYDFVKKIGSLQIIGRERHGIINLEPSWSVNDKNS